MRPPYADHNEYGEAGGENLDRREQGGRKAPDNAGRDAERSQQAAKDEWADQRAAASASRMHSAKQSVFSISRITAIWRRPSPENGIQGQLAAAVLSR